MDDDRRQRTTWFVPGIVFLLHPHLTTMILEIQEDWKLKCTDLACSIRKRPIPVVVVYSM